VAPPDRVLILSVVVIGMPAGSGSLAEERVAGVRLPPANPSLHLVGVAPAFPQVQ